MGELEQSDKTPPKNLEEILDESIFTTPPASPRNHQMLKPHGAPTMEINSHQVLEVVQLVKKQLMGTNFCFTGGVALYLWAKEYGEEFTRGLKDIDIVTNHELMRFKNLIDATSVPGPTSTHITGRIGDFSIDVLSSGKGLGNIRGGTSLQNDIPVASLTSLKHYKLYQIDHNEGRNNIAQKDLKDLELIDKLQKLHQEKFPEKYIKSTSPNTKESTSKRLSTHPSMKDTLL
jgi:hypothetical protein